MYYNVIIIHPNHIIPDAHTLACTEEVIAAGVAWGAHYIERLVSLHHNDLFMCCCIYT